KSRRVDLYYQAEDGISHMPTSFRQAQMWLMGGYFNQSTKFKIMRPDGSFGEWETLGELISRNGRSLPFIEDSSTEEEKKKRDEELRILHEEMNELNTKKAILKRKLEGAMDRQKSNEQELNRLNSLAPVMRTRSIQTQMTQSGATTSVVPPEAKKLSPPPSMNPFALLYSCEGARSKLPPNLAKCFNDLRDLYERCDRKLLVSQTKHLFTVYRKCSFCFLKMTSACVFLEHVTCAKHVESLQGVACADAYKFWYDAVRNDPRRNRSKSISVKPGLSNGNQEPSKRSAQGATPIPPPDLPVFSLLRPEKKADKPCQNPKEELAKMRNIFNLCDKKKLDNDKNTLGWFEHPMLCLICNRCAIDKVANLISHITSTGHIEMVLTENHPVSQNALDFWMNAIRRAKSIDNESTQKKNSSAHKANEKMNKYNEEIKLAKSKDEKKTDERSKLAAENISDQSIIVIVSKNDWKIGDRCVWKGEVATVRWIGTLEDKPCAGLEFDEPIGRGTGTYQGNELFCTTPNHAGFVNMAELRRIDIETVSLIEYNGWKVGRRCIWEREEATVRWIGTLKGHESVYAGLAFDEPVGEGTGTYQGTNLFHISDNHAVFVKLSTLSPLQ
ncbi:hypothetical protein PMAYCL1PPCAC_32078, partial [Pristionchus mayeri]